MLGFLSRFVDSNDRELKRIQPFVDAANALGAINDNLRTAAASFGNLFGTAGKGFANLINEITNYSDSQAQLLARIEEDKKKGAAGDADRALAEQAHAQNQIRYYGNMLGAAKSFFKQTSAEYKVLEAAERAYRIYQLAAALIESVTRKKSMTEDTAHTASTVSKSAIRATAHGIEAIARALASLPFPLNLFAGAATAAALVAAGVKVFGHGGGGSAGATSADKLDTSKITSDSYSSPYSTQPGKNGLYDPANAGTPPAGANYGRGGMIVAPVYNIHAPGADAGTVQQIHDMLAGHTENTVTLARQAAAQDAAALAGRQRIGGA